MKGLLYILGAGESGIGAAVLGKKLEYEVWVSDHGVIADKYLEELADRNIAFEQGGHDLEKLKNASLVIISPGIPLTAKPAQWAMENGIEVISEIEFASRHTKSKIIAITGTNGKTTTTGLCHHMLKTAGLNVGMVGNIGKSFALEVAENPRDYYVIEVSSFQLDTCFTFAPDIAILCNITPDHLDRYQYELEKYAASKFRITQAQNEAQYFIYSADDALSHTYFPKKIAAKQFQFSLEKELDNGAFKRDNQLIINNNKQQQYTMNLQQLGLNGLHNTYNSMAAAVMGNVLNIKDIHIRESLLNFENIEHRLEFVATVGGVKYINDSKATNVNAVWYALESADEPLIWIAGGVDKGNDYAKIKDLVRQKVKMIICLGENNLKLHQAFGGDVDLIINTTSAYDAVQAAYRMSQKGDTVLLSPACASFDLFDNYEDRGRQFKAAVKSL